MGIATLTPLVVLSLTLHLWFHYRGPRAGIFIFKPLTLLLILAIAALGPSSPASAYQGWIIAGLVASLAGDVFLMLPGDRFVAGLLSFLLAHGAYLMAFAPQVGNLQEGAWWIAARGIAPGWIALGLGLYGLIMGAWLWPGIKRRLRPAVILYLVALLTMAGFALPLGIRATIGALLFVVSDSILAINRFRRPFGAAQVLIMTTYEAAQWFLAWTLYP